MNKRDCVLCGAAIPSSRRPDAAYCGAYCSNKARHRRFALKHPDKLQGFRDRENGKTVNRILARTKYRAKKEGIPFNLTLDDIIIPSHCPILGFPLEHAFGRGRGGGLKNSPSLDRKIPELGYVQGNVGIISHAANCIKSNATLEQLKALVAYMEADVA